MSRRNTLFVLLLLTSALAITAALVIGDRNVRGQDAPKDQNSIARINAKAALLNTGDEAQIRDIADQVFQSFDLDQVSAGLAVRLVNNPEVNALLSGRVHLPIRMKEAHVQERSDYDYDSAIGSLRRQSRESSVQ